MKGKTDEVQLKCSSESSHLSEVLIHNLLNTVPKSFVRHLSLGLIISTSDVNNYFDTAVSEIVFHVIINLIIKIRNDLKALSDQG